MKTKTSCFILLVLLMISTISIIVNAESDPTGDIWHYTMSANKWSWEAFNGDKPNIDITDISYSISDSTVTLSMSVAGTITDDEQVGYYMHLKAGDNSYYQVSYFSGQGIFMGRGDFEGTYELIEAPPVSDDGTSLTYTFEVDNPDLSYEAWGFATEYSQVGEEQSETWSDYVPGSYAPWYSSGDGDTEDNGDDNGDGNGDDSGDGGNTGGESPGFEFFAVVIAVGALLVLLRRKK